MNEKKQKRSPGQPKKEATTTISLRISKKKKRELRKKYPKPKKQSDPSLNKMFNEWVDGLLTTPPAPL